MPKRIRELLYSGYYVVKHCGNNVFVVKHIYHQRNYIMDFS